MAAAVGQPAAEEPALDVTSLHQDKIKELMGRDPRFITRLITELDKSMHSMMLDKEKRKQAIKADQEAMQKIDDTVAAHIKPNLDKLTAGLAAKKQLRDEVQQQLNSSLNNFKDMEREAAALVQMAKHATGKIMRTTASQRLQEARGYTATVPTTTLIKSGSKAASSPKK